MRMLLDTGTTMNYRNLTYHLWVMSECSEIVGELIQYGADASYDVVQNLATLNLDSSH